MSETIHIKELADKISGEIFTALGWKKSRGPTDYSWPCIEQEKHGKKRKLVHPTDVVFHYDDPYKAKTVYVNSDLKSYSKASIEGYDPHGDLLSLAASVECANKSEVYHNLHIYEGTPWTVEGMLFVYNHDREYDRDFATRMEKAPRKTRMPGNQRVFVIGPKRITDLYTIARDLDSKIQRLSRADQFENAGFLAPDLDLTKVQGKKVGPATLEMLIGPWLIHQIRTVAGQKTIQLYYQEDGPVVNDFKFLIDALLHFQLLEDMSEIEICVIDSNLTTATAFVRAKTEYAEEYHGITEDSLKAFEARLQRIKYASVPKVLPSYFELEQAITHG